MIDEIMNAAPPSLPLLSWSHFNVFASALGITLFIIGTIISIGFFIYCRSTLLNEVDEHGSINKSNRTSVIGSLIPGIMIMLVMMVIVSFYHRDLHATESISTWENEFVMPYIESLNDVTENGVSEYFFSKTLFEETDYNNANVVFLYQGKMIKENAEVLYSKDVTNPYVTYKNNDFDFKSPLHEDEDDDIWYAWYQKDKPYSVILHLPISAYSEGT